MIIALCSFEPLRSRYRGDDKQQSPLSDRREPRDCEPNILLYLALTIIVIRAHPSQLSFIHDLGDMRDPPSKNLEWHK